MIVRRSELLYSSYFYDIMLLSDEEHFAIILSAIRDYKTGENDISILIVEKVVAQIIDCVNSQFTTQDILDEIIEVFNFYNDFITQKKIKMKLIPDEMGKLVEVYINEVIKECWTD